MFVRSRAVDSALLSSVYSAADRRYRARPFGEALAAPTSTFVVVVDMRATAMETDAMISARVDSTRRDEPLVDSAD